MKKIAILLAACAVFFGAVYLIILLVNQPTATQKVSAEQAQKELARKVKRVTQTNIPARKSAVELLSETSLADELPEISRYPLTVEGTAALNIEIFSSPEKAGSGKDGWLNEMAQQFNALNQQVAGQTVSVSVRSIASGTGADYIRSGKYLPDAFTPSNKLWGDIISTSSVKLELVQERLVGNVAGVLLEPSKAEALKEKYGDTTLPALIQATSDGELTFGYTNPFTSSTGLNFLLSALHDMDATNPLSADAAKRFETFQANIPFVAYTTTQMKDAVSKTKSLDLMVQEYQAYGNTPELSKYSFIPFGIRHDNPLYAIGELSAEKRQALAAFVEYCKTGEAQQLATRYGFNGMDDYAGEALPFAGNQIVAAQQFWKENKDVGRPVIAVFVADTSGSMGGVPLNELRSSLINAAQYIDEKNYIGLISYNDSVYVNLPIERFDINQRAYFTGAVEDLHAGGNTATFDAVLVALDMIEQKRAEHPEAKPMLFVLSDGKTNRGNDLKDVSELIGGLGVPIYTIGYNANLEALEQISAINEAATINATSDDVMYQLKNLFTAQM